jgi:predicted DNA binding CopG/RHH family protein
MAPYVDYDKPIQPAKAVQRVNVDFPTELLRAIDREATRIGVTRQAWIKLRLADTLKP